MEDYTARYFLKLYFECRESKTYPFPGTMAVQTAFTTELFDYLDEQVNTQKLRQLKTQKAELARQASQNRKR